MCKLTFVEKIERENFNIFSAISRAEFKRYRLYFAANLYMYRYILLLVHLRLIRYTQHGMLRGWAILSPTSYAVVDAKAAVCDASL
jgi:hypothetical protein